MQQTQPSVADPQDTGELQVIVRPRPAPSVPSIKSYGVEVTARTLLFAARQRRLTRIVVGTIGACGVILVAAGVAHLARANGPAGTSSHAPPVAALPPAVVTASPTPVEKAAAIPAPTSTLVDTTGTVHIQRPAAPGHVWIDGKKLTTSTVAIPCGQHQLKVGTWGRVRSVEVPCGGDLQVSR